MKNIIQVNVKQIFRNKLIVGLSFLAIIASVFIAISLEDEQEDKVKIGFIITSNDSIEKEIVKILEYNYVMKEYSDAELLANSLYSNELVVGVELDDDGYQLLSGGDSYADLSIINDLDAIYSSVNTIESINVTEKKKSELYKELNDNLYIEKKPISDFDTLGVVLNFTRYFNFFVLFLAVIIIGSYVDLKETKVITKLRQSRLGENKFYCSLVLTQIIIFSMLYLIGCLLLEWIVEIDIFSNLEQYVLLSISEVIYFTVITSLIVTLYSFIKNEKIIKGILPFFTIPIAMLSGLFWPIDIMPIFLQKFSNIFPTTWIIMQNEIILEGGTIYSKYFYLLILMFIIVFVINFAKEVIWQRRY